MKIWPVNNEPAILTTALQTRIAQEIVAAGGWLPFDRFMELALYAPGLGYYSAGARKFGPGGDFTTAPERSPPHVEFQAWSRNRAPGPSGPRP